MGRTKENRNCVTLVPLYGIIKTNNLRSSMIKVLFLVLLLGSVVSGATNFPSHIGMGSKASTVGKISSYSPVGGGLWSGYWKPNGLTVSVKEEAVAGPNTKVWPNPSNGIFNIEHIGGVKVFSQIGTLVFQGDIDGSIDLTNAPSGTQDGKTVKIIKQ